jgi:hypothetical protein
MSLRCDNNHQLAEQSRKGNDSSLLSEFVQVASTADAETGGSARTCGDKRYRQDDCTECLGWQVEA